jgi:uncharacterized protein (DUF2147 family)
MRAPTRRLFPFILWAALAAASAQAQAPTIRGYWREPGGSIVHIAPCGRELCIEIAAVRAGNHPMTDVHNSDPGLRQRPLCGLRIGAGFVEVDPQHARGGHLYDPRSGRTYSGQMTAAGGSLELRGYVGLPMFGRTQIWVRVSPPPPCSASLRRAAARHVLHVAGLLEGIATR